MPYQFDTSHEKKLLKKKIEGRGTWVITYHPKDGCGWVAPSTQVRSGGSLEKCKATHLSPHWWRGCE
jgi:hypothetical protein